MQCLNIHKIVKSVNVTPMSSITKEQEHNGLTIKTCILYFQMCKKLSCHIQWHHSLYHVEKVGMVFLIGIS